MHTLGEYKSAQRDLDGGLCVTFTIDDERETLAKLEELKDKKLVLEFKKYNPKRSLNANAYFWLLCDKIAKVLGSDKDTIYLLQLKRYGTYEAIEVIAEAQKYIEPLYRVIEVDHYFHNAMVDDSGHDYVAKMASLRCYIGSSHYDSKEMADLINGTVNDCHDLGIETWTPEEINNLVLHWEGRGRYDNEIQK